MIQYKHQGMPSPDEMLIRLRERVIYVRFITKKKYAKSSEIVRLKFERNMEHLMQDKTKKLNQKRHDIENFKAIDFCGMIAKFIR